MRGGDRRTGHVPLVLLANVILLAQVDEVSDGFGGEELETVDDVDLDGRFNHVSKFAGQNSSDRVKTNGKWKEEWVRKRNYLMGIMGRYSRLDELGYSSNLLFIIIIVRLVTRLGLAKRSLRSNFVLQKVVFT